MSKGVVYNIIHDDYGKQKVCMTKFVELVTENHNVVNNGFSTSLKS